MLTPFTLSGIVCREPCALGARAPNGEESKPVPQEYQEFTKQIWTLRRVRLKDNLDGHIAPFPVELPYRCIGLYSFVGDTVLDPFAGSGTSGAHPSLRRHAGLL